MFRKKDNDPVKSAPRPDSGSLPDLPKPAPAPGAEPRRGIELPSTPGPVGAGRAIAQATAADAAADGKRLIVGPGISLSGEITACDRLIVEGTVEATLNETRALEITETGKFSGGCEVEEAEISGNYVGDLTVRKRLLVRSSGKLSGNVRYGELEVERGGLVTGSLAELGGAS